VTVELSFLHGPLPAAFRRRVVVVEPGGRRAYDGAEWRDELVVVERGRLDLECHNGGTRSFPTGAVVCLDRLALRALHNRGADPTVLVAVSRRPRPERRPVEPRIVDLPERPYLGVRRTCTGETVDQVADRVPEIIGHLLSRGGTPAGAPFLRYRATDPDGGLDVEACVPTDDVGLAGDQIVADALPAGRYAVLLHRGHPDGLAGETQRLLAWAARAGHTWDRDGDRWGARTEHFLTHPLDEPDPHHWESEVAIRLADT
jgi:effector-binding domain-containing protein